MNEAHFQAVIARLEEDDALDGKVHDAARVDANGELVREVYVVVFGGSPAELGRDRLYKQQVLEDDAVFDFTIRSVAPTPAGCRAVATHVAAQLVDFAPTVEGRRCRPIRFTGGDDVRPDISIKPPIYFLDEEYELRSLRA